MTKKTILTIKKVAPNSPKHPVLEYCLLKGDGTGFVTNLDISYAFRHDLDVRADYLLVPIKTLDKLLSKITHISGTAETVTLHTTAGVIKVPSISYEDYPLHGSHLEWTQASKVDVADLLSLVPFCGKDEYRLVMHGIQIADYYAATDGATLRWLPCDSHDKSLPPMVVHADVVKLLDASSSWSVQASIDVKASGDPNIADRVEYPHLRFSSDSEVFVCPNLAMEEPYPNWPSVVPKDNPIRMKLDAAKLDEALKMAANAYSPTVRAVAIVADEIDGVMIHAQDTGMATEFTSDILGECEGGDLRIGVNAVFMAKCFDAKQGTVTIEASAPNRAMVVDGNTLIMPVQLPE